MIVHVSVSWSGLLIINSGRIAPFLRFVCGHAAAAARFGISAFLVSSSSSRHPLATNSVLPSVAMARSPRIATEFRMYRVSSLDAQWTGLVWSGRWTGKIKETAHFQNENWRKP